MSVTGTESVCERETIGGNAFACFIYTTFILRGLFFDIMYCNSCVGVRM